MPVASLICLSSFVRRRKKAESERRWYTVESSWGEEGCEEGCKEGCKEGCVEGCEEGCEEGCGGV